MTFPTTIPFAFAMSFIIGEMHSVGGYLGKHVVRAEILGNPGDPMKGTFFKGFAFLFSNGAYGTIASSLAISFASQVVQEATRRPRA